MLCFPCILILCIPKPFCGSFFVCILFFISLICTASYVALLWTGNKDFWANEAGRPVLAREAVLLPLPSDPWPAGVWAALALCWPAHWAHSFWGQIC